jgi:UDP-N-acetylmuramate dehydrogenase
VIDVRENVPLAPRTTLELGGAARWFVEATNDDEIGEAVELARSRGLRFAILGGGSNLVVDDAGFDGLVLRIATRGVRKLGDGAIDVAAGEIWDDVVASAVAGGLAGLECLSGIPGTTGATPIQNVGAYGQEVSDTITSVRVLDRRTLAKETIAPDVLRFGYRTSTLRTEPDRYVVLGVVFALRPDGAPTVRYAELANAVGGDATLTDVRATVLALRRKKSMVIDPTDPNRRSAGSFFTNPIVDDAIARDVIRRAIEQGIVRAETEVPRWPAEPGKTKLAAGWLIERAGVTKGTRRGHVGVSTAHALALVHHGGGTTYELDALANEIRDIVRERFGITLEREPIRLGP